MIIREILSKAKEKIRKHSFLLALFVETGVILYMFQRSVYTESIEFYVAVMILWLIVACGIYEVLRKWC